MDTLIILWHEIHCMESGFTCTLCGRCCKGFGRYITINQAIGGAYACTLTLTKETFMATLDPGRSALYRDRSYGKDNPHACPFLRQDGQYVICTIYNSRPRFCREYICHTGKVVRNGVTCGVMKGRRDIEAKDEILRGRWNELKNEYGGCSDPEWKREVFRSLTEAGYEVVFYG